MTHRSTGPYRRWIKYDRRCGVACGQGLAKIILVVLLSRFYRLPRVQRLNEKDLDEFHAYRRFTGPEVQQ